MPTIVIIGAGPGLGLSIAKVFGRRDFTVALISRDRDKLDGLVKRLTAAGVTAASFAADITDHASVAAALDDTKQRFGAIDVLEHSPAPRAADELALVGPLDVTVDNVQAQLDFSVHGAITAIQRVLPDMVARGNGTILVTTGASSVAPVPMMGNVGIAGAALRNWVLNLNQVLADKGVYVAHVPLAVWIGSGGPETQPDTIAELYWDLYTTRREAEHPYNAL
jgi:short-subunit dehydrogenase